MSGSGQVLRASVGGTVGSAAARREVQTAEQGCSEQESSASDASGTKEDLDEVRKVAFQAGFTQGEQAAEQHAETRWKEAIDGFGRTVGELVAMKHRLRTEAEREVVNLAFAIARRVVHRELTVDPTTILGIVRTCLDELHGAEVPRIEVSGADLDAVREYFGNNRADDLEIVAGEGITRGGAILDTTRGRIDARIESQLQEIERGLSDG